MQRAQLMELCADIISHWHAFADQALATWHLAMRTAKRILAKPDGQTKHTDIEQAKEARKAGELRTKSRRVSTKQTAGAATWRHIKVHSHGLGLLFNVSCAQPPASEGGRAWKASQEFDACRLQFLGLSSSSFCRARACNAPLALSGGPETLKSATCNNHRSPPAPSSLESWRLWGTLTSCPQCRHHLSCYKGQAAAKMVQALYREELLPQDAGSSARPGSTKCLELRK